MSAKQEILDALKAIENETGCLTADAVVESARDPDSPLHDRFEWDDAKAAAKQRIATARRLIVSARMDIRYQRVSIRAPYYMRDPAAESGVQGYRNVMRLRSEPEEAHAALTQEMSRVAANLKRARNLAVVLGVSDQLDAIEAQVGDFLGQLAEQEQATAA